MRSIAGLKGIQPLEAQFVQLLAGAVSAGLARVAREAEAARARVQFEQFFSPELATALQRDVGILAAQERELTLLFADLRGFSKIAERIGARETYDLLSDILDRLTDQIMDHGGVVIDYYGDGLAAMWNAPFDHANHAIRAAQAALAMQAELPAINIEWAERLGGLIRIGIGLNTGLSQVGNAGSQRRLKYGPRGHAVNLASRIEGATKVLGVPCLMSGATQSQLDEAFLTRRICRARVTGMVTPVDLHELSPALSTPEIQRRHEIYGQALASYELDRPAECLALCEELRLLGVVDKPLQLLTHQAQERIKHPEAEFDAVYSLETK
jgi:adenylate cyclase